MVDYSVGMPIAYSSDVAQEAAVYNLLTKSSHTPNRCKDYHKSKIHLLFIAIASLRDFTDKRHFAALMPSSSCPKVTPFSRGI